MFYKYYKLNEYSKLALENGEVWTSSPREFNDPFDCLMTLKFSENEINNIFKEWAANKSICCFSRNFRNILMWSHYADSHRGFCIGIDNYDIENSEIFSNVIYSKSFLEFDNEKIFLKHDIEQGVNRNWEKILTHKALDWAYEEEVRLILELGENYTKGRTFHIGQASITQVFFGLCMSEGDKEILKNIMKGRSCTFYQMVRSDNSFALEAKQMID